MRTDTFALWRLFLSSVLAGVLLLLSAELCSSAEAPTYTFMYNATAAPSVSHYDYIVVGGGTAGCPLAATLSQGASVLVLERGGSPYGNPNITHLSAFAIPLADLSPDSPSQRFISEDGVVNDRARVLGGGTALNAGFYSRASLSYIREAGWEERLVNESYKWVEEKIVFEPDVARWQAAVMDGLLEAGVVPYNGFTYDHIKGTKIGGTIFDQNDLRHTAADLLQYADPSSITVLLHATVQKVLFKSTGCSQTGKSKPKAHGVLFKDSSGQTHKAYLRQGVHNDIILSAGAIGSPQVLMLSGLGPPDQLKSYNVTVVSPLSMVGQGMADNPMNLVSVPSPAPIEVSLVEVVGITPFGTYIEAVGGFDLRRLYVAPASSSLPMSPDSESEPGGQAGVIFEKVERPKSSGHLELRSLDPDENPAVRFNYFQDPLDLKRCVQGMQTIQRVIESKALSDFRFNWMTMQYLLNLTMTAPINLRPRHAGDTISLEQFCNDTVMTIWHYHGGCQVGKVVDEDYKVIGVERLRVVDGSTFINSPGTNPQATIMMLGRYMGVKILRERSKGLGFESLVHTRIDKSDEEVKKRV